MVKRIAVMSMPIIKPTVEPKHTESIMDCQVVIVTPSLSQEVIIGEGGEIVSRRGLAA